MRSWIPWALVIGLMGLVVTSAIVGAKHDGRESARTGLQSASHAPAGVTTIPSSAPRTLPPESGYRGIESFCAVAPLTGTIHYDGASGTLSGVLTVNVSGLPPSDEVNVNWSNDYVRAPVIASFETDSQGTAVQSSVDVGRLGEVRGVEIVLTAASVPNPVLGRLEPC